MTKCPTWILNPFLQRLLKPSDVQRLGGHSHQGHDLKELLLTGLAQLMHVVAACEVDFCLLMIQF
jgi:hypothetical protein